MAILPSARKVGDEKVNGTPTTHYRAEPDLKTLTYRMITAQRAKLASRREGMRRYLLPRADVRSPWATRRRRPPRHC
ncbi:hypothetical protein [Streptomyces mobaraensis]|uniref:hypothetical protein n=1 Tax=Streptomyces mobaraensis TaxID=35621 RepID=UPI00340DED5A